MDCIYVYIKKYIPETSEGNNKYGRCIKPNRIKKKGTEKKKVEKCLNTPVITISTYE